MLRPTDRQPALPARMTAGWRRLSLLRKILAVTALTLAPLVAGLIVLILLLPPVPAETPEDEAPAVKPIVSETQDRLDQAFIATKISRYIALTTWAELAHGDALENQESFYRSFMAEPDLECATAYQQTRRLRPQTTPGLLFDCARQGMSQAPPPWTDMTPIEREARSRRKLQLLWKSIAPEYWINTGLAFQQAREVNRANNEEFRQFAEPYDVCIGQLDPHVKSLAVSLDAGAMSAAWIAAAQHMQTCSDRITENRFPLPPGSKNGPDTTPERIDDGKPPRSQPDSNGGTGNEVPKVNQMEGLAGNP